MLVLARISIVAILGIVLGIGIGFGKAPQANAPTELVPAILPAPPIQAVVATTTIAESTTTPVAIAEKPKIQPDAAAATSSPKKTPPPKSPVHLPAIVPPQPAKEIQTVVSSIATTLQATTTIPTTGPTSLSDTVRAALVNIVCTTQTSGPFNSISGSGVMIDSRGIILTNSHVAQFFLLKDYPTPGFVNCVIRTGSPAYPRYMAELLFMPPSWMAQNAFKINDEKPTGNGEHDYALLRITGTVGPNLSLPALFPHLSISTTPAQQNQDVLVAGYPAGFLGGITIATSLYAASAEARVGDLYTFAANTPDLFSIGGTIVSQQGSSGGAVTDTNGTLVGVIVTATDAPDTASRDLRAIATPYIIQDFQKEAGISLQSFLGGNIDAEEQSFMLGILPTLRQELVTALESR